MDTASSLRVATAANRFGLGEPSLQGLGGDAAGWLMAQIGPAEPQRGEGLVSGVEGLRQYAEFLRQLRQQRQTGPNGMAAAPVSPSTATSAATSTATPATTPTAAAGGPLRQILQADVRARLRTAALSQRPFNERLALFWANHFTVSTAKGSARGIVGAFEREAIRPHIAGNFATLLQAAVQHAGMLRYLDNDNSAGPDSALVRRLARRPRAAGEPGPRITGLNENLAREVLELHTLGVAGGYTQTDVTEFAKLLTGWRVPLRDLVGAPPGQASGRFDAAWHQPGPKTVLGKRYGAGPEALPAVLQDLAHHPSTARFISTKLARHFVADDPPAILVTRLAADFEHTGGDLSSLYRSLVQSPEAWLPQPAKLKTPEEFVISSARVMQLGEQTFGRQADAAIGQLGQRVQAAPSPAGWPDRAEEWLGPDAVWKRVEWATRVAAVMGRQLDARQLARDSLGPLLQADTLRQIERAADGPQALALLLLAPEFQRR